MRWWICVLMGLVSPNGWALTCWEPKAGLLVSVVKEASKIHFRLSAERGYESIPQMEGPLSVNDMKMFQFQTESLKSLGSRFQFSVPVGACDLNRVAEGIFACSQEAEIEGQSIRVFSFTGFRNLQKHVSGDFEIQNFRLLLGQENLFFFSVPFVVRNCTGSL